jgi:spore germination cell wall hydrolase CwlJ-like protein
MITIKKLLVTLIASVMLSLCFGATAFASELATSGTQTVQENTVDTNNADSTIEGQSSEVTPVDELSAEEVAVDDEELLLEEGYFIDEQGQVYYEAPKEPEEIVIEEVVEEEIEDTKDITKEDKEPVVKKLSYTEKDLRLLSCLIYSEAGNQTYNGMLAVANVVLNRVKSDIYWHVNTVEEVIYDHRWSVQFAVTIKGRKSGLSMLDKALKCYDTRKFTGANPEAQKKAMNKAIKAAKAALEGTNNIGNYLCFQNKRSANSIKRKYSGTTILGDHIFYRTK